MRLKTLFVMALMLGTAAPALAARPAPAYDERPAKFEEPKDIRDFDRRVVDIPMRDGVKLHTVILVPKGAKGSAMLLTRTPYNAEEQTGYGHSPHMAARLDGYDNAPDVIAAGHYIRVVQDVRGK